MIPKHYPNLYGEKDATEQFCFSSWRTHTFKVLYALDAELLLAPGASHKELSSAMEGHILAEAELVGTYA